MVYIGSLDYDDSLKETEEIIVCGAGSMLPSLMEKMAKLNLSEKIMAICDNNIAIHGKRADGILVMGVERVYREYTDADYIVYNRYFMEICKQLQENHIKRIHLIRQGSL